MKFDETKCPQYDCLQVKRIDEVSADGYLLKHKKSGAKLFLLSNDDDNKVFTIGFRTPPSNDTGVAHIIEHTLLCGSEKFPLKDPFLELAKGSLNTFLNAMTYPDKTLYPIASYNDKDFQNLMDVYMDAVFHPNIYKEEKIFRQEGWHYHMEDVRDNLTYNGVVYNEMKGALSSPEDVLDREILNALFPDNCYSFKSAGDPQKIPELTYEEFLNFHRKYYHPSNSYIYLYGDMDMEEKLNWLDKEYLCRYDKIEVDSEIRIQKPFEKPVNIKTEYAIPSDEEEKNNTYLSYNVVVGDGLDVKLYYAMQVLEYAVLGMEGAPLRQALLDEGIGTDVIGGYEDGILQPFFSVIVKESEQEKQEQFLQVIRQVCEKIVKEGFDKNSLRAGLNNLEFKFREADFGQYPKGLMYGLEIFSSWLYDENAPFAYLEAYQIFEELKREIEGDYFEKLLETYLLDNSHTAIVMAVPKKGLTAMRDQQLAKTLQAKKEELSQEKLERLAQSTRELIAYQEEPTPKEAQEKIPLLKLEDIKQEPEPFFNEEKKVGDIKVIHHNVPTNGIGYMVMTFNMNHISEEMLPYVGILKGVFGSLSTQNYSYTQLCNEISIYTGGILFGIVTYEDAKRADAYKQCFNVKAKALYENIPKMFALIQEIIFTSEWENEKRIYECLLEMKSHLQMDILSAGQKSAMQRAFSYSNPSEYRKEKISGIDFYEFICQCVNDFEKQKTEIIRQLKEAVTLIFCPQNCIVSYTSDEKGYDLFACALEEMCVKLYATDLTGQKFSCVCKKKNEGFMTSGQVQYVARTGNFIKAGLEYTGVLKVLRMIMNYDYLWNNVRVKGGAYGCFNGCFRNGDCYFVSYRDPHLKKTNEVYEDIVEYVKHFEADEREMVKFIIGTISDMDIPLTPSAKGSRSFAAYMTGVSYEILQKERNEVLTATVEDIRKLAAHMEAVLEDDNFCVIGSEEKIKEHKDMFMECKTLS